MFLLKSTRDGGTYYIICIAPVYNFQRRNQESVESEHTLLPTRATRLPHQHEYQNLHLPSQ